MNPPLVIGYGNCLRQDDGLGCRAARLLEEMLAPGAARILQTTQLTPELAAEFEAAPVVILLDAALDLEPGMVVAKRVSAENQLVWSHDLSAGQLTALAEQVLGIKRPVYQITGGVRQTGLGEKLTPEGQQCAARIAEAAIELLKLPSKEKKVGFDSEPDPL